jgi:hypothetical protein
MHDTARVGGDAAVILALDAVAAELVAVAEGVVQLDR